MKLMNKLLIILFIFLFFNPESTEAFDFKSGTDLNINDENISKENLYLLGGNVIFDKIFEKDVFSVSGKSFIDGTIFGDLQVISGESFVNGEIFGDSRIIGGTVNINGNTNEDLVIISGKTKINQGSIINGEALIFSGEVLIEGQILDDLKITAGTVTINGEILGDVEITAQDLNIGSQADIKSDFVYFSPKRASISSGAQISQKLNYNQIERINENELVKKTVLNFVNFWTVIKFLAGLFTAFILIYVFRMFSQKTSNIGVENYIKCFLIGLLSILLIPIAVIILTASLFGIPIAMILIFIYFMILILTAPVSGIIIGYLLQKLFTKRKKIEVDFNFTAIAIILLTFVYLIPFVGILLKTILTILAFGSMIIYYFELITIKKK